MNVSDFLFGQNRSLQRGLLLNIIAALSLCLLLAIGVMVSEFYEHLQERGEDAMADEAIEIIGQIEPTAPQYGLDGTSLRFQGIEGTYRYTVFDETGNIVVGGEGSDAIWQQLSQITLGTPQSIDLLGERLGLGLKARVTDQDVFVLVSMYPTGRRETQIYRLLHEIEEAIWWIALGILFVLISALLATRRALSPLKFLSDQAQKIGPAAASQRLTIDRVPAEIAPLIEGVNKAFDRLEQGYKAQRDFSSNVAHEIRTPIAVLKSSIDRIDDPAVRENLSHDAKQLDRIFGQLVDLSRADAALQSGFQALDLRRVAVDVATDLAPTALRANRSLSVAGEEAVLVHGHAGLLSVALANIVRNALQYTSENSAVEIEVLSNPPGLRVLDRGPGVPDALKTALFERFNRGLQTNSGSQGSGIGLAIVKSVARSHGATVDIQDREGGGSVFYLDFDIAS